MKGGGQACLVPHSPAFTFSFHMTSSTICSDKDIWQVKWPRPSLRWWWHPSSGSKCCYWYSIPAKVIIADTQYKGTLDCVSYPQETWILSFWHGTLVDVIRYFPTQTLNFFFKDKCHQIFLGSVDNSAQFWFLLCRGVCIRCFAYPLDFHTSI